MKYILISLFSLVLTPALAQKSIVKEQKQAPACQVCEDLKPALEKGDIVEGIMMADPILAMVDLSKDPKVRDQELSLIVRMAVKFVPVDMSGEQTPGDFFQRVAGVHAQNPKEFEAKLRQYSVEEQAPVWEAIKETKRLLAPGKDGMPKGESPVDKPKKTGTR